jgi:hypothetical protein
MIDIAGRVGMKYVSPLDRPPSSYEGKTPVLDLDQLITLLDKWPETP